MDFYKGMPVLTNWLVTNLLFFNRTACAYFSPDWLVLPEAGSALTLTPRQFRFVLETRLQDQNRDKPETLLP